MARLISRFVPSPRGATVEGNVRPGLNTTSLKSFSTSQEVAQRRDSGEQCRKMSPEWYHLRKIIGKTSIRLGSYGGDRKQDRSNIEDRQRGRDEFHIEGCDFGAVTQNWTLPAFFNSIGR